MVPVDLLERTSKPHQEWSTADARKRFELAMGTCNDRISVLLSFFRESHTTEPNLLLENLGNKFAQVLPTDQFSFSDEQSGLDLTDQGYHVAVDLGMLIGALLVEQYSTLLKWELATDKRFATFNHAIVVGWGKTDLEPVGLSINLTKRVARGELSYRAWLYTYQMWKQAAENALRGLPLFDGSTEAEQAMRREHIESGKRYDPTLRAPKTEVERLFKERDELLARLEVAAGEQSQFRPDHSPESLKTLEAWYFDLFESQSFGTVGASREEFERWIAVYLGAVFVHNASFKWVVDEDPTERGTFFLATRCGQMTIDVTRQTDLYKRRNNTRHQSVWRFYKQYSRTDDKVA
jgi:hypothetical protein